MNKGNIIDKKVQIYDKGKLLREVPIDHEGKWNVTLPDLGSGEHIFRATIDNQQSNPWTIVVGNPGTGWTVPHFRNAKRVEPNREEIDYYTNEGSGTVEIPDYGMRPEDTVRVTWVGRNITVDSEIQTVANPPVPLTFVISKYEIIDCIGTEVAIHYTVKRQANPIEPSVTLHLEVVGQSFTLSAPTISNRHDNLRIYRQAQFNRSSTGRVRAIGLSTWQSEEVFFNEDEYLNFQIDPDWLRENRGKPVLFNWSLKINLGDSPVYYSQILRVDELQV